uniref:ORF51c n=1 Tax=Pinus koraiensis TaxID=88728 RepID=Q85X00_PINKO|nr:ORF51c [Pinus koraiensis]
MFLLLLQVKLFALRCLLYRLDLCGAGIGQNGHNEDAYCMLWIRCISIVVSE